MQNTNGESTAPYGVKDKPLRFVFLGLSITSACAERHAATYRNLVRELHARGHDVLFLERDTPWYAAQRDLPQPAFCTTALYDSLSDLQHRFTAEVRAADAVVVGSYVPQGSEIGEWVVRTAQGITAFYDLDTPVTIAALRAGRCEYLTPRLVTQYQLYLSATGGSLLELIEHTFGSPAARPLYCSVDPLLHRPLPAAERTWDLGYMGVGSTDRQPMLERLLLDTARRWAGGRFAVIGPGHPASTGWPGNVRRIAQTAPMDHRVICCQQRFTLNVTRAGLRATGYAPGRRLFAAAACGTPVISDDWEGLETFFTPDREILVARTSRDVLPWLIDMPESERRRIGARARKRVLREHTAAHRARELESYLRSAAPVETVA